ncbi:MAG: tRNA (N(6)-L-threonylcarbamoyladenosine(37)-C(2))-methylthiotransferase MtaB [Methylococcales bacterium]
MKVNLKTLGCRLNEAESETWAQQFQMAGHSIVRLPEQADLIVLNTCAVTTEAGRKSRQMIRRLHRGNPAAKLVVSGCYATLEEEQAAAELGVDLIIRNQDKHRLVDLVKEHVITDAMPAAAVEPGRAALFQQGRQRAFIKVQDGCRYRCTFCIVTVARGEERSRPVDRIIEQINLLHGQGIQEVILTGVHLGGYGAEFGIDLYRLIREILDRTGIPRIRLGSLEPWDIPDSFFKLFSDSRMMPHLHLPLQSASDSVLRRMARRCKTEGFIRLADRARSEVDDINLTTDIIVGFPGETEHEWRESLANIEKIGFGQIHIFTYSAREGTKAASLANQVPRSEKKQRSQVLHQLSESMKLNTFRRYLGRQFPVLWEARPDNSVSGEEPVGGYTPNFLRVAVPAAPGLENSIRLVRLTGILDSGTGLQGQFEVRTEVEQRKDQPFRNTHSECMDGLIERC